VTRPKGAELACDVLSSARGVTAKLVVTRRKRSGQDRQDNPLRNRRRTDASLTRPLCLAGLYEYLEAEGYQYAIRLPANDKLHEKINYLLTRPVGRPPKKPVVSFACFEYRAASWTKSRRVVVKVEWYRGELYPRVGFIVTNMIWWAGDVVRFYNQRGIAEQRIKEGKYALKWTRLSCCRFVANQVRLQLFGGAGQSDDGLTSEYNPPPSCFILPCFTNSRQTALENWFGGTMAKTPEFCPDEVGPYPIRDSSSRRVSLRRLRKAFIARRSSLLEGGSGVGVGVASALSMMCSLSNSIPNQNRRPIPRPA